MTDTAVFGARGRTSWHAGSQDSANALVMGPVDTATPFSGTRLLEDGTQLAQAIEGGDWLSGTLAGAAAVGDALYLATNPVGAIVSMGIGWVLDHLEPLKGWLNELTGDAGAVLGGAGTWGNIAAELSACSGDLVRSLDGTLGWTQGVATDAYKQVMADVAAHLDLAGQLGRAISGGLHVAASIVQVVHDLVRDAIADIIGVAVSSIIPTPKIIADVIALASKWATRLGDKVRALITSFDNLSGLFRRAEDVLDRLKAVFGRLFAPVRGDSAVDALAPARRAADTTDFSRVPKPPSSGDITNPAIARQVENWLDQVQTAYPGLSRDGVRGLWDYSTDPGYTAMNNALRGAPGTPIPPAVQQRIDAVHEGIANLPPQSGTTYRGTNLPQSVLDEVSRTGFLPDKAFTSSSTSAATAAGFIDPSKPNPVMIQIEGTTGVSIKPFSAYGNEGEVLLGAGTPLRVIRERLGTDGILQVVVTDRVTP